MAEHKSTGRAVGLCTNSCRFVRVDSCESGGRPDGERRRDPALEVRKGSEDFSDFYRREYPGVVRLAFVLSGRYELAEDVAQEAFLAAERRWHRLVSYDSPSSWVRRVTVNRSISHYRKARSELWALPRLVRGHRASVEIPERDAALWDAVRSLPTRQGQVLALLFVEDRSALEVAALLGCSEETVRTHARRGRRALQKLLELAAEKE